MKHKQLETLLEQLRNLEQKHQATPDNEIYKKLVAVRRDIRTLLLDDTAQSMIWTKQTYYEKSNKTDSLLARTLRPRQERSHITAIKHPDGTTKSRPDEIAKVFEDFYKKLYNHTPDAHTPDG
ncbi:Hypothetical predicted protein, partial [Pelobates cultripes]